MDAALLRHILGNLLSNAVKYSPAGSPVELTLRQEEDVAVIVIQDHGIGIPEADQARLYEAFHRASNVGETPGTGLGLLLVKRCVELHHGSIHMQSQEGTGTTFTVRLPLRRE
jgi:signal transduction histidine kinase